MADEWRRGRGEVDLGFVSVGGKLRKDERRGRRESRRGEELREEGGDEARLWCWVQVGMKREKKKMNSKCFYFVGIFCWNFQELVNRNI